jgi:hypothetical protein
MGRPVDEKLSYNANGSYWDKRVALQGSSAGYSTGAGTWSTKDANPPWTHYAGETLADLTGVAIGTYNYYLDMATFRQLGLQFVFGGAGTVTLTVEASAQDDGTAPASVAYKDVTNAVFGSASFPSSDFIVDDARFLASAKWVKVKVVVSGATADYTIYSRRSW